MISASKALLGKGVVHAEEGQTALQHQCDGEDGPVYCP